MHLHVQFEVPPPGVAAAYKKAARGQATCAGTGYWIESMEDCQKAAASLGLGSVGTNALSYYPYGCFYREEPGEQVYFGLAGNRAGKGPEGYDYSSICNLGCKCIQCLPTNTLQQC